MTTLEEVTSYNGRSSDRRRPDGPSHVTIQLYDLLVQRPEGVTIEEAAEHIALGFPTDGYRTYAHQLHAEGISMKFEYGSPEFKRRAHRAYAVKRLAAMVKNGTAFRDGSVKGGDARWFAGRPPRVTGPDGRRHAYTAGSDAALTAKGVETVNMMSDLRSLQRRLKRHRDREAIEWAIRKIQGKA